MGGVRGGGGRGALGWLILLLTVKGWSPSFVVWIIPFLIVVYPNGRGLVMAVVIGTLEMFWRPLGLQFGYPDALVVTLVMSCAMFFVVLAMLMYRAVARSGGAAEHGAVRQPVAP